MHAPSLEELVAAVLHRYAIGDRCPAELEHALRRRLLAGSVCPAVDCPLRQGDPPPACTARRHLRAVPDD